MKKSKHKMIRAKYLFIIVFSALIMVGYFITISTHPTFVMYSEANTSMYIGKVTNVYTESHYTGYKSRQRTKVYIELDSRDVFYIPNLTLRKNDCNYETLKETVLNNTVEISTSKIKAEKIVSIKFDQHDILTYDDMNKTQISNRLGLGFVCVIVIAFVALWKLLP